MKRAHMSREDAEHLLETPRELRLERARPDGNTEPCPVCDDSPMRGRLFHWGDDELDSCPCICTSQIVTNYRLGG